MWIILFTRACFIIFPHTIQQSLFLMCHLGRTFCDLEGGLHRVWYRNFEGRNGMLGSNPSKPSLLLSSTSCLQIYQTRPRGTVLHRKMLDLNYSETYKANSICQNSNYRIEATPKCHLSRCFKSRHEQKSCSASQDKHAGLMVVTCNLLRNEVPLLFSNSQWGAPIFLSFSLST